MGVSTYGTTPTTINDPTEDSLHTFTISETSSYPDTPLRCYTSFDSGRPRRKSHCGVENGLKIVVVSMFVFATAVTVTLLIQLTYGDHPDLSAIEKTVADTPICSNIGNNVMKLGGNAVDAAVAATLCESLTAPHMTGLGGGGFMLIHRHRHNQSIIIDFREMAANSANGSRFFDNPQLAVIGKTSIAVPGFIKGLEHAHRKFGSQLMDFECCSWSNLIKLVLNKVRKEFVLTDHFINATRTKITEAELNIPDGNNLREFIRPNENLFPGMIHQSKFYAELIKTYEDIATNGSDAMYFGRVGETMIEDLDDLITMKDLGQYKVEEREPIKNRVGNYEILASGPPSSGTQLLAFLNAVELMITQRDIAISSPEYIRKVTQILKKLSRIRIGDPQNPEVQDQVSRLLDKEKVAFKLITDAPDSFDFSQTQYGGNTPGGSLVAAMDFEDNYVSVITSLNSIFGSKVMTSNGILLNNALGNFDIDDIGVNKIAPGKRPLSPATVALAINAKDLCGMRVVTGGATASDMGQVLSDVLLYHNDLKSAIKYPRIRVFNNTIGIENAYDGFDEKILEEFRQTHSIYFEELPYNSINAVDKSIDNVFAIKDPRST